MSQRLTMLFLCRSFHFGSSGLNMNSYFQDVYFKKHAFNAEREVEIDDVDG